MSRPRLPSSARHGYFPCLVVSCRGKGTPGPTQPMEITGMCHVSTLTWSTARAQFLFCAVLGLGILLKFSSLGPIKPLHCSFIVETDPGAFIYEGIYISYPLLKFFVKMLRRKMRICNSRTQVQAQV